MKGGALVLKALYGKKFMGIERSTLIVDEDRFIIKIFRKVRVKGHAEAVFKIK